MPDEDRSLTVLLVEDNPGDARLVEHHLRQGSFPDVPDAVALTHVESMTEARETLDTDTYDVVLLDLGLPESTGGETVERFIPEVSETPVVVLTGLDDKAIAVEAIRNGAQDYLPKDGLGPDTLLRSLRYAIERHRQEQELRRQTEQMRFFNSVLRHDVGNGMEVIRRNAQLLEADLDDESRERAETILSWSDDIIDLTGKVRRMLDTVTGTGELSLEPVNLSAALRDQIEQVRGMDSDLTVASSIPDDVVVTADGMLPEVVGNILRNAVEHNDADEPRLEIEVADGDSTVTVRIADNGPGIPDEQKERIFGRGEAAGGSGGFGLYFVRTMIDSYGGEVQVRDGDPTGSVFHVTLPAA